MPPPSVVNTGASPPTLSVIAPTPRSYNFPTRHNLAESPCPSPCDSPELKTPPPRLDFALAFSPSSSIGSPSSPTSPRRRKSTSLDTERRPKKGDEGYVKRPENAFMLFRRRYCEDRSRATDGIDSASRKLRQADLSKTISLEWKNLSAEQKQHWQRLAEVRKKEHEEKYPGYVFRPQRARDADGKVMKNKKRVKRTPQIDADNFAVVLPNHIARSSRRSLSAPTPPLPYSTIHVPNVYITPSCPTSPSLIPLIERRASYPGHPEDIMSNFDYLPSGHSAFSPDNYKSSELHNMFNMTGFSSDTTDSQCSLLPAPQITTESSCLSIDSGSSGPSSPPLYPVVPLTTVGLSQPLSQLDTVDWSSQSQSQSFESQTEFISPESNCQEFDYPTYVWGSNTYSSIWSSPSEGVMLSSNDFDINAIPGVEFGVPQYAEADEFTNSQRQHYFGYQQPPQHPDDDYLRYDDLVNF